MSFTSMKRDELFELAVNNFAVDVDETATKPQIIAALAESGVTWEMAKTFDANAAAVAEAEEALEEVVLGNQPAPNVITSASTRPEPEVVSVDPVVEETVVAFPGEIQGQAQIEGYLTLLVPKGVDGTVRNGVFYPSLPTEEPQIVLSSITSTAGYAPFRQTSAAGVLVKMERENPHYETRGYTFTQSNPFAVVSERDADYILTHEEGFKVASPREAKEFYG